MPGPGAGAAQSRSWRAEAGAPAGNRVRISIVGLNPPQQGIKMHYWYTGIGRLTWQ